MTFNVPIRTELASTNVVDSAEVFDNTVRQNYPSGKELRHLNEVFRNDTGASVNVPVYDAVATYAVGDLSFKDSVIKKLISLANSEVPKQPQDYAAGYDHLFNHTTWSKRYTKIAEYASWNSETGIEVSQPEGDWSYIHTIYPSSGSNTGWYYRTQRTYTGEYQGAPPYKPMVTEESNVISEITASTVEQNASVYANKGDYFFVGKTVIVTTSGVFVRTDVTAAVEYETTTTTTWSTVTSPEEAGFTYLRVTYDHAPFDARQYTSIVRSGDQTWAIKTLSKFDGIALGKLRGDTVDVVFKDSYGNAVYTVTDFAINDTIDANLDPEPTTAIIYADQFIDANGMIEITIYGNETEVGHIFPTASIDAGLTDLEFQHEVRNFDRNQVSEISGYVDHIKGNRVILHKGSFRIKMVDYDKLVLLNRKLTQELIAVDGSDNKSNAAADGNSIFNSTQIICRIKQLRMKSTVKDGDMAVYTAVIFEFEEVV